MRQGHKWGGLLSVTPTQCSCSLSLSIMIKWLRCGSRLSEGYNDCTLHLIWLYWMNCLLAWSASLSAIVHIGMPLRDCSTSGSLRAIVRALSASTDYRWEKSPANCFNQLSVVYFSFPQIIQWVCQCGIRYSALHVHLIIAQVSSQFRL